MAVVDQPRLEPSEGRGEDRRPLVEHDLDRGIHEIRRPSGSGRRRRNPEALAEAVEHLLGSAQRLLANRVGIDGRPEGAVQPQVHAERAVRQLARAVDHRAQIVRRNVEPGQDPEASGAAHLHHQVGTGDGAHAGLDDRVLDVEEIAQRCAEGHGAVSLIACSRSLARWTLSPCGPGVRGTSFTNLTTIGILYDAILPRQNARSSSPVSLEPSAAITYATGASFSFGSGTPTTNACTTSGWDIRNASISPGATMKWLTRSVSRSRPLKIVWPRPSPQRAAAASSIARAVASANGLTTTDAYSMWKSAAAFRCATRSATSGLSSPRMRRVQRKSRSSIPGSKSRAAQTSIPIMNRSA